MELLGVLVIVAAVAGIVVGAVSWVARSSDLAASAANQAGLRTVLSNHASSDLGFPSGLDSFLIDDTGDGTPDSIYRPVGLDTSTVPPSSILDPALVNPGNQVGGPPTSGALWKCYELILLTNEQSRSLRLGFLRRDGRSAYVFDHTPFSASATPDERDANQSPRFRREWGTLGPGAPRIAGAVVRDPNQGSWSDLGTVPSVDIQSATKDLLRTLVPSDFDATGAYTSTPDSRILILGVGARCALVPAHVSFAPVLGADPSYYGRFVAYFRVFNDGRRTTLLGVGDSFGRLPATTQMQFAESLEK